MVNYQMDNFIPYFGLGASAPNTTNKKNLGAPFAFAARPLRRLRSSCAAERIIGFGVVPTLPLVPPLPLCRSWDRKAPISVNGKGVIQRKHSHLHKDNAVLRNRKTAQSGRTPLVKKDSVLSLSQLLSVIRKQRELKAQQQKRQKNIKPIMPPKKLVMILKEKPEKILYNRRIIDYKHCGLLQRYIGLGGKILPRRQTRLTAKQQRYIAKTIKSARIMGLLPFVSKEKGYFK
uniref:Small ribosomal subunit protein bS18c n=1 Tax=Stephanosphaera pluvialis TaxID=51712 RepID=A0A0S2IDW7_9CHLO|nr:ribosomal protein S18 [Stephanosphaera pluvialis]